MKISERANYYSSDAATSNEVMAAGLSKLTEECRRLKVQKAWLVTNTKQNVGGLVSAAIGQQAANNLMKGMPASLSAGCSLTLYTERDLPHSGDGSPVLVCHPTEKLLTRLDGLQNIPSLIVLPWTLNEVQPWVQAHGPADIRGKVQSVALSIANPVVEHALEYLWQHVNVSTGISHSLDKHKAIQTFKILKKGGEAYTSEEVRAWLVRKGMAPRHADEVAAIADTPGKYRSAHGNAPTWNENILSTWRQEAEKPGKSGIPGLTEAAVPPVPAVSSNPPDGAQ